LADNRKISIKYEQKVVRKGNLFVVKGSTMKYAKKAAIDIIVKAAINYLLNDFMKNALTRSYLFQI